VFASLSQYEGLGLPPLEAMAAGALVCGFDGQGGQEYATPDNGFWVADGDLEGFAHAVAKALDLPAEDAQMRVLNGQATVSRFTESRFEQELELAWRALLGDQSERFMLPQPAGEAHAN
jgi:glycosyltransferase involved in cell wall biosynthesis